MHSKIKECTDIPGI